MSSKTIGTGLLVFLVMMIWANAVSAGNFTDFEQDAFGYEEVSELVERDVIRGFPSGDFRPGTEVNRADTAIMFYRALELSDYDGENPFQDVSDDAYYYKEAVSAYQADIFRGNTLGEFGPTDTLTREQMASVIVRAFGLQDTGDDTPFSDLGDAHKVHQEDIRILYQHGVTTGTTGTTFTPKGPVPRVEFAVFMYRALTGDTSEPSGNPFFTAATVTLSDGRTVEAEVDHSSRNQLTFDFTDYAGSLRVEAGTVTVNQAAELKPTNTMANLLIDGTEQFSKGPNTFDAAEELGLFTLLELKAAADSDAVNLNGLLTNSLGNETIVRIRFLLPR